MSGLGETVLTTIEAVVLTYTVLYLLSNLALMLAGARPTLDQVRERGLLDLDQMSEHDSTIPRIAIVVPAYNEERTIVESVRSLFAIDYPDLELIVVNDGSVDRTRRVLREAFTMRRRDIPFRGGLETADIRAIYEGTGDLPDHIGRFLLIDKANGGRSDALNAGLRVCTSPLVLTIDADCIVDPESLKHLVRIIQSDTEIIAVGGQVGVVNDCEVEDGRVVRPHVARDYVPLCQTVEYVRAFSVMRTGFSRLSSLLILSGAFMLLRRDVALDVGGFMTGRSKNRLLTEYVGPERATVCEDMEIIVRIHRMLRQQGRRGRVVHAPVPLVWTEVPPNFETLAKQRRRWHRGLLEILWMHRDLFLNPAYGRIGLFAYPYFLWFEAIGPWMEAAGLFLVPILGLVGWLDPWHALLITGITLGSGILLSLAGVLVTSWMEPTSLGGRRYRSLLGADSWRDRFLLIGGCVLTETGYRQLTVWWRLRATIEYFRGYTGWDKFERKGFKAATTSAQAIIAFVLALMAFTVSGAHAQPRDGGPRTHLVTSTGGFERRDGENASSWVETVLQHGRRGERNVWFGTYHLRRSGLADDGMVLGYAPARRPWGGFGLEARVTPNAEFSPEWTLAGETEFLLLRPVTGSIRVRRAEYAALSLTSAMLGGVVYLPRNWWCSAHFVFQHSDFGAMGADNIYGFAMRWNLEERGWRVRVDLSRGGESFLVDTIAEIRDIKATFAGVEILAPLRADLGLIVGTHRRSPERGNASQYFHAGVRIGF